MPLNIKSKIRLGTFFLFLMLILTGGLGICALVLLKNDARKILNDNYESLNYAHSMQEALAEFDTDPEKATRDFESNLSKQEKNITEKGEREITVSLRAYFERLKMTGATDRSIIEGIRADLREVIRLNMQAIQQKNASARQTAEDTLTVLSIAAALVFLTTLTFSINFPSIITRPITKLKEAVAEISNKNYEHRIHLNSKDEFSELAEAFNGMAEKLDMYEHSNLNKLMFEKARAEAVVNSMEDAGIGIDQSGTILFANRRALNLLGLKDRDVVGKKADEVKRVNDLFRFLIDTNSLEPFKIVIENKENFYIKELSEIRNEEQILGKIIILKNITPFREKDIAKTNFLATVSHELKTPLASSNIGLTLLSEKKAGNLSEQQREIVSDLQKDNQRLIKLVGELLDLSQAESGNINLFIQNISVNEPIEYALLAVKQQAAEKGIRFGVSISANLPEIRVDKEKTAWVLVNLLSNAVRYSPPNETIEIRAGATAGNRVFISVIDKGPGIAPEYRKEIFKRFFTAPNQATDRRGTGLGLSISKEFMNVMQGEIGYSPNTPHGSVFTLTFPTGVSDNRTT